MKLLFNICQVNMHVDHYDTMFTCIATRSCQ